jgi:hypothetical protein
VRQGACPFVPVQVHARLRPGSRPANETYYIVLQAAEHSIIRDIHVVDNTIESYHTWSLDTRAVGGKGYALVRCFADPALKQPCSNLLLLYAELTPPEQR